MIRDSIIYVDMDKITAEPSTFDTNINDPLQDTLEDTLEDTIEDTIQDTIEDTIQDTIEKPTKKPIEDSDKNKKEERKAYAYLRPLHCEDSEFVKQLYASKCCKEDEYLSKGYDSIFSVEEEKKYVMSLHYLNYQSNYMSQLTKIMVSPPKLFTLLCDPLARAVRHFNHSNSFRSIYTFEEYYYHFGDKERVGWTGTKDITNNYFSHYLGFRNLQDITKENIIERFLFIMIVEKEELSIKKLNTLLNTKIKTLGIENDIVKKKKENVNAHTKQKFKMNNQMDYLLYDLCCEILEE